MEFGRGVGVGLGLGFALALAVGLGLGVAVGVGVGVGVGFGVGVAVAVGLLLVQAEEGMRDVAVTGVQTCALPIYALASEPCKLSIRCLSRGVRGNSEVCLSQFEVGAEALGKIDKDTADASGRVEPLYAVKIGRASCRERV